MFKLNLEINKFKSSVYILCSFIWHARLRHVNKRLISNISRLEMVTKLSMNKFEKCEFCSHAKITKTSHKSILKEFEPLDLIHFDLCEFDGITTRGSKIYFITFIDDCFEFTFIYLLKNKSEALDAFKSFVCEIENQHDRKVKSLYSDKGIEHDLDDFDAFYNSHGIIHKNIVS